MSRPLQRKKPRAAKAAPAPVPLVVVPDPGIVEVLEAAHEALRAVKRERRCAEQILDASAETG